MTNASDPREWESLVDNQDYTALDDHPNRADGRPHLQRLALALRLTMEEMVNPVDSGAIPRYTADAEQFEKGKRFAEGWDAAVDYVNGRLNNLLFHTDDEDLPWPFDLDAFRSDFSKIYKKR